MHICQGASWEGGGGSGSGARGGGVEEIRRPLEAEVPEQPQFRYIEKCISKPGHFPPRFVQIAVHTPPPEAT
jgi:hypothetical protein